METPIVVIGAGVTGLTTALLLSKNPEYTITVAAKHMPGDYDIEYASPWAGADYLPVSVKGSKAQEWDKNTWPELEQLAKNHPEAGVHFQDTIFCTPLENTTSAPGSQIPPVEVWYKDLVPNFRPVPKDQLNPAFHSAYSAYFFTSVCINPSIYLPWLVSQCLEAGVTFKRDVFTHIREAANIHHSGRKAELIINCTGLSARRLGGVEDQSMVPVRGQTVLVRNDPGILLHVDPVNGKDELCYVMKRAAGGGTLLGGCIQHGNWDPQVDLNLANRIMKKAVEMCPALTGGKGVEHLSVIRHGVGLRPLRIGGTRLEKEKIEGLWVVHNYGHAGFGYQSSYGCAQVAVKLVEEIVALRAKL